MKRQRGLTMIELLVAVSILVLLLATFGTIITYSQRAVSASERAMRANSAAAAIARLLRQDLENFTREGFMAVYRDKDGNDRLVFTTVSTYKSMVDDTTANAARIDYGVTPERTLWRRAILLNPAVATAGDHEQHSLASYALWRPPTDLSNVKGWITAMVSPPSMASPPATLAEIAALWPMVHSRCGSFRIEWSGEAAPLAFDNPLVAGEMQAWTAPPWPVMLRVTFTAQEDSTAQTYEVLVNLSSGQG